jgi:hypothetical protein
MVKGFLTVQQHHFDHGADNDSDPAGWNRASYTPDLLAELGEPLPEAPNGYREAALYHLRLMYSCDEFLAAAPDSRVAIVAVAVVLGWPSARGLSVGNIADQLGCSLSTLTRSIARFKTMAGLAGGGFVSFGLAPDQTATSLICPGRSSNGTAAELPGLVRIVAEPIKAAHLIKFALY